QERQATGAWEPIRAPGQERGRTVCRSSARRQEERRDLGPKLVLPCKQSVAGPCRCQNWKRTTCAMPHHLRRVLFVERRTHGAFASPWLRRVVAFLMSKKSGAIAAMIEQFRGQRLDAHYLGFFGCLNRQLY